MVKILSWNVNGIRAILKKGFLDFVQLENPDILCLQETKASPEQLPDELLNIPGYQSYFSSSLVKKGYSGVAIYTKTEPVIVEHGYGIERFDAEGRIIIAQYDKFVLINNYYPNGKASDERLQYKMDFYDAFLEYTDKLKAAGKHPVICGDFNTAHKEIDLARPKENSKTSGFLPIERNWMDVFINHGYVDTFRMFNQEPQNYTWWDMVTRSRERNVGWRIDYFFASDTISGKIKDAVILPSVMGSDHCPVGVTLDV
ncbi:MAG: exodeoxyribonuclease III [Ignavibacteriales bacterium]|nr:exodeoxyribonuclease III [Ignavibacteriales bacterium]